MRQELADFLDFCRLERRLAPLTCSAYERDVGACLAFLEREGIDDLAEVRPADLRRFLADESKRRPAPSSQARTVAALGLALAALVGCALVARQGRTALKASLPLAPFIAAGALMAVIV